MIQKKKKMLHHWGQNFQLWEASDFPTRMVDWPANVSDGSTTLTDPTLQGTPAFAVFSYHHLWEPTLQLQHPWHDLAFSAAHPGRCPVPRLPPVLALAAGTRRQSPGAALRKRRWGAEPRLRRAMRSRAAASADRFQSAFCGFYWNIPAEKEAAARAGAGSPPAVSAVIRLYSSGFRKQKHVYHQATNQNDINSVEAKLKQSFRIIFWFRSHLLSRCKYFLQIRLRKWWWLQPIFHLHYRSRCLSEKVST